MKEKILKFTDRYEHFVVIVLLVLLMIVISFGTFGLLAMIAVTLYEKLGHIDISEFHFTMPLLHEVFKGFLMILIGLELIKTVVMYLDKHLVHVEVVLSVAMIAIARHVIDMDLNTAPAMNLVGTGVIIFALALAYYYFKKSSDLTSPQNEGPTSIAQDIEEMK